MKNLLPKCGFYFIQLLKSINVKVLMNIIYFIDRYPFHILCKYHTNVEGICQHILYVLASCKVKSKDPVSCTWSIATN